MISEVLGKLLTLNQKKAQTQHINKHDIKIGSDKENDIVVQDVSLKHCCIQFDKGLWYLTNLSIEGTFLNNVQIYSDEKVILNNWDEIYLYLQCQENETKESIGFTFVSLIENSQKMEIKGEPQIHKQIKPNIDTYLNQFTCSICTDLYYKPVYVIPCLHTFCGACFSLWAKEKQSCPNCRTQVTSAKPNGQMEALVDIYLTEHPENKPTQEHINSKNENNDIKKEKFFDDEVDQQYLYNGGLFMNYQIENDNDNYNNQYGQQNQIQDNIWGDGDEDEDDDDDEDDDFMYAQHQLEEEQKQNDIDDEEERQEQEEQRIRELQGFSFDQDEFDNEVEQQRLADEEEEEEDRVEELRQRNLLNHSYMDSDIFDAEMERQMQGLNDEEEEAKEEQRQGYNFSDLDDA